MCLALKHRQANLLPLLNDPEVSLVDSGLEIKPIVNNLLKERMSTPESSFGQSNGNIHIIIVSQIKFELIL